MHWPGLEISRLPCPLRLPDVCESRTGAGRKQSMTRGAGGARGAVHAVLASSLGELTVVGEGGAVTGLYFPRHWPRPDRAAFGARGEKGFDEVARQLSQYLNGDRRAFNLPVKIRGSESDRRVWKLIAGVAYGETITYGEIARCLGAATAPRDVGAAVGRNPLCILIPCHRVVGATGNLTGYAGGLGRKRTLLEIEHAGVLSAGGALSPRLWYALWTGCSSRSTSASPRCHLVTLFLRRMCGR
jgi:methylated-DNA-[protein]-cysteine S-methyltransferase